MTNLHFTNLAPSCDKYKKYILMIFHQYIFNISKKYIDISKIVKSLLKDLNKLC